MALVSPLARGGTGSCQRQFGTRENLDPEDETVSARHAGRRTWLHRILPFDWGLQKVKEAMTELTYGNVG
jgi:hypothetical protein